MYLCTYFQYAMWKFKPILKRTVWGGGRIAAFKAGMCGVPGVPAGAVAASCGEAGGELPHIGESYELSGMPGHESVVNGGPQDGLTLNGLAGMFGVSLLGRRNVERTGSEFPLLVKFLDARENLSIQVHPDDDKASLFGLANGKSELWYMLHAEPQARLCVGFKAPLSREEYVKAVADGSIEDKLNYMPVKEGDLFYIPGGTVHALCKGCLVLEIQQPSETTFRIYDYGRRGLDGRLRELHTEQALEVLDFNSTGGGRVLYPDERETSSGLLATRHFTVNRLHLSYRHHRDYKDVDSFKILTVVSGTVDITDSAGTVTAGQGAVLLVAACERLVTFMPHGMAIIIETYI